MRVSLVAAIRSVALLAVGATFVGCGSSTGPSGSSDYFFRFDANGTKVEYTAAAALSAAFGHSGPQFNGLFVGFNATSNANVQVFDGAEISKKTYSGYGIVGTAFFGGLVGYQPTGGPVYTSGANAADVVVIITDINSTTVTGTFQANLTSAGQPNIAIRNGEFHLKRAN